MVYNILKGKREKKKFFKEFKKALVILSDDLPGISEGYHCKRKQGNPEVKRYLKKYEKRRCRAVNKELKGIKVMGYSRSHKKSFSLTFSFNLKN